MNEGREHFIPLTPGRERPPVLGILTHRHPCQAAPPRLGPFQPPSHTCECLYDDETHASRTVTHRCRCGITWTIHHGINLSRRQEARIAELERQTLTTQLGTLAAITLAVTAILGWALAVWLAARHGYLGGTP